MLVQSYSQEIILYSNFCIHYIQDSRVLYSHDVYSQLVYSNFIITSIIRNDSFHTKDTNIIIPFKKYYVLPHRTERPDRAEPIIFKLCRTLLQGPCITRSEAKLYYTLQIRQAYI